MQMRMPSLSLVVRDCASDESSCEKQQAKDKIKKAYYDKMKICHPDIAGDDGWGHSLAIAATWRLNEVSVRHGFAIQFLKARKSVFF